LGIQPGSLVLSYNNNAAQETCHVSSLSDPSRAPIDATSSIINHQLFALFREDRDFDSRRDRHLPRKVRGELIVYEDLLVERPRQALPRQPDQLRLVLREADARVQLVGGYDVGALVALVAGQELVEGESQVEARHDVDVRQQHVVALAVLARQIAHVILRIHVAYPPAGLLARYASGEFVESGFRFRAVNRVRQLEDTRLLPRWLRPRHGQREGHPLAHRLVAPPQVHQVTLQHFELVVAGSVQRHGHGTGPVQGDLHQRVQLLHGALGGQANPMGLRQIGEVVADQDRVEGAIYPARVPPAEPDVQPQAVSVR